MRKLFGAVLLGVMLMCSAAPVSAKLLDYEDTLNTYKQDNKTPQFFETDNGNGKTIKVVAKQDTLYLKVKRAGIRSVPGKKGERLCSIYLGSRVQRVGVCENGWSKVVYEEKGKDKVIGYVLNKFLSDQEQILKFTDTPKVIADSDILDFPGRKDGEVVGEVLEQDEVTRTGTIDEVWSRILYQDEKGGEQIGYIPTSVLEAPETEIQVASADTEDTDEKVEAGLIHKSEGGSVFTEAVDAVADAENVNGVQIGTPMAVSSDAALVSLGTFRITHYCPCSICCGPWADGITSTGVTATTNHTIAVDPSQIPYGSQVVINGQVYVAEDCGGAIKTNCIDVYVASHEEGETKGVYYTDVYLIQ